MFIKNLITISFFIMLSPLCGRTLYLTIDDAPMEDTALFTREEKIQKHLAHLKENGVQAIFFCIGSSIEELGGFQCLQNIADERHLLANHSYHHFHTSKLSSEEFANEILRTEALLSCYSTTVKIFRFPSLDYGNKVALGGSEQKKQEAFAILERLGYQHGYVTLNTFDWLIDRRLQEALKSGKKIDYKRLKEVYFSLLDEWMEELASAAFCILNREFEHALLLHENDLNALFLGELIQHLKKRGWFILPASEGFKEPLLQSATPWDLYYRRFGQSFQNPLSLSISYIDHKLEEAAVFTSDLSPPSKP